MIKKKHPFVLIALLFMQFFVFCLAIITLCTYFISGKTNYSIWLCLLFIILNPSLIISSFFEIKAHYARLDKNYLDDHEIQDKTKFEIIFDMVTSVLLIILSTTYLYLSYMNDWEYNITFWAMLIVLVIFAFNLYYFIAELKDHENK